MDKGFNLQVEELKQNIIKVLNNSNMPIAITTMVLQELLYESNMVKQQVLTQEKSEYDKSLVEEIENDKD